MIAFRPMNDELGTIAPGKIANLLVLNKNPLEDIRNTRTLETIILKGRRIEHREWIRTNSK